MCHFLSERRLSWYLPIYRRDSFPISGDETFKNTRDLRILERGSIDWVRTKFGPSVSQGYNLLGRYGRWLRTHQGFVRSCVDCHQPRLKGKCTHKSPDSRPNPHETVSVQEIWRRGMRTDLRIQLSDFPVATGEDCKRGGLLAHSVLPQRSPSTPGFGRSKSVAMTHSCTTRVGQPRWELVFHTQCCCSCSYDWCAKG